MKPGGRGLIKSKSDADEWPSIKSTELSAGSGLVTVFSGRLFRSDAVGFFVGQVVFAPSLDGNWITLVSVPLAARRFCFGDAFFIKRPNTLPKTRLSNIPGLILADVKISRKNANKIALGISLPHRLNWLTSVTPEMNKAPAHPSPVIDFGVETVRGNHDPDCPVVVPLDKSQPNPTGHIPFAAILALDRNDRLAREPRLCIHVFMDEDGISFADGIFTVKSAYPTITSPVPFPQLCVALRRDRREWSPLLNIKIGEKPHLHVKNWQEGDKVFNLPEQQSGAAACLRILNRWNSWEAANETWQNRMYEIVGHETFTGEHIARDVSRAENKFTKLCNSIGLEKGKEEDHGAAFTALHACLAIAAKV